MRPAIFMKNNVAAAARLPRKGRLSVALLLGLGLAAHAQPAAPTALYLDPAQPLNARVNDLISKLTLEEKPASCWTKAPPFRA